MPIVKYTLKDSIAWIQMDDGKANAISYTMIEELEAALDRAEKEASAVVLSGRPGRFSAGFDLQEMKKGVEQARALVSRGARFFLRFYLFPRPLIITCTGHALAGGALLLLTGDVRIGFEADFRIGLNEVQIGMPVPILAMELARDRLEPWEFQKATLFSEIFDPEEATSAGFLDLCMENETAMLETVTQVAMKLAALPREAFAKTKEIQRERTAQYILETLEMDMARLNPPV